MPKVHCLDCNKLLPPRSVKKGYSRCRWCLIKVNQLHCIDCGKDLKRRSRTDEGKRCIICSNKFKVIDPIYKQNHKMAMDLLSKDPEWRKKRLDILSEQRKDPNWQANNREALLQLHNNPEWKEKQRLVMEKVRLDPVYIENQLRGFRKWLKSRKSRTSIENKVCAVLKELGINFSEQKFIKKYAYDFYLPDYNLLIEADGCFWHGCEICGFKKSDHNNDSIKTQLALNAGFLLLRLPEHEINANKEYIKLAIQSVIPQNFG